jgi:hypothetical protein
LVEVAVALVQMEALSLRVVMADLEVLVAVEA